MVILKWSSKLLVRDHDLNSTCKIWLYIYILWGKGIQTHPKKQQLQEVGVSQHFEFQLAFRWPTCPSKPCNSTLTARLGRMSTVGQRGHQWIHTVTPSYRDRSVRFFAGRSWNSSSSLKACIGLEGNPTIREKMTNHHNQPSKPFKFAKKTCKFDIPKDICKVKQHNLVSASFFNSRCSGNCWVKSVQHRSWHSENSLSKTVATPSPLWPLWQREKGNSRNPWCWATMDLHSSQIGWKKYPQTFFLSFFFRKIFFNKIGGFWG